MDDVVIKRPLPPRAILITVDNFKTSDRAPIDIRAGKPDLCPLFLCFSVNWHICADNFARRKKTIEKTRRWFVTGDGENLWMAVVGSYKVASKLIDRNSYIMTANSRGFVSVKNIRINCDDVNDDG